MPVSLSTRRAPNRSGAVAQLPGGLGGTEAPADLAPPAAAPSPSRPSVEGAGRIAAARRALVDERRQLTLDELSALAALPDADVPTLAEAAHAVRVAWCGDTVEVEGILSAKTGGCPEDCHFCSQSSKFDSPVKAVPLLSHDEVLRAARETADVGASEFCLVYAVRGPDERLMAHLEEIVPLVERETG